MTQQTTTQNPVCGARKRQGEGCCKRPAGWGTDHVGFGTCKLHGGKMPTHRVAAARAEASAHLTVTGVPVDPATALLVCVQLAAGHVEFASRQVDLKIASADDPEQVALGPWGRVQAEAMDRLARYSKIAIDAGATQIQLRYAEREGAAIGTVLRKVFDEIELTPEQRRIAPDILERHLKALEEQVPIIQKKD